MAQNMRSRWMECALILACAGFIAEVEAKDVGWPREFNADGRRVIVYQPQVDSWKDHNKMVFVAAVEVVPKDAGKSAYGVIRAETDTETNVSDRTVTLSNRKILDLRFPNLPEAESAPLKQSVLAALPPPDWKTMVISLDRVNASLQDATGQQRKVEVNYDPPRIFYSDKPAILVSFIGKPQFKEVPGTGLMAAANTNWDVFLDPATTTYYLLNGDHWLSIKDVKKDKWQAVKDLPAGFARLPQDPNWEDVRKNIPGKPVSAIPKVCVSTTPAELIVTDGDPEFAVIPGTTLLEVTNTDSVLFFHGGERNYYYQVAGRWFRAEARSGPWKVASHDLPEDFKNIPDTDANAFVKATVPGTMEAKDASMGSLLVPAFRNQRGALGSPGTHPDRDHTRPNRPRRTTSITRALMNRAAHGRRDARTPTRGRAASEPPP